jgi:hypothetical protein
VHTIDLIISKKVLNSSSIYNKVLVLYGQKVLNIIPCYFCRQAWFDTEEDHKNGWPNISALGTSLKIGTDHSLLDLHGCLAEFGRA